MCRTLGLNLHIGVYKSCDNEGRVTMQVSPWLRILITRSVALVPTLLVVFITSTPNKLDVLNQWLNILQSVQLVFAVLPVSTATTGVGYCAESSVIRPLQKFQCPCWTASAVDGYRPARGRIYRDSTRTQCSKDESCSQLVLWLRNVTCKIFS